MFILYAHFCHYSAMGRFVIPRHMYTSCLLVTTARLLSNFLICFLIPFLRCNNVEASIRYSSTGFQSYVIEKTGLFSSISRTRAFIFLFLTLQQTFFNLLSPVCKYGELKNEAIYDAHDFTKASHEKKRLIFHRFFAFLSRFILASKNEYSGT